MGLHFHSGIGNSAGFAEPGFVVAVRAPQVVQGCKEILEVSSGEPRRQRGGAREPTGAAMANVFVVPRSSVQHAAVASCARKLQCLRIRVRQISRERDRARLDLQEAEQRCLQLVDEHRAARQESQGRLRKIQTEMKAKDLLLQQAIQRQAKLEADAQLLQGREANLQGTLNLTMKENTQLQNKVMNMSEKLSATEKLVLELQKELDLVTKDKRGQAEPCSTEAPSQREHFAEIILEYEWQCRVLWEQNTALRGELQRLRLLLRGAKQGTSSHSSPLPGSLPPSPPVPGSAGTALAMRQLQDQLQDLKVQLETKVNHYQQEMELMKKSFERERKASEEKFKAEMTKMEEQKKDLEETAATYWATIDSLKEQKRVWSPELEGVSETEGAEAGQQHPKGIWHLEQRPAREEDELLTRKLCDRSGARCGSIQHQSWRLRGLETAPRPEQEQHPEQAAMEPEPLQLQPGGSAEQPVGAWGAEDEPPRAGPREQQRQGAPRCRGERPAQAQALLCATARSWLLIEHLREGHRELAQALRAARLEQKRTEDKNRALEGQVSALKQLVEEMAPASLSV